MSEEMECQPCLSASNTAPDPGDAEAQTTAGDSGAQTTDRDFEDQTMAGDSGAQTTDRDFEDQTMAGDSGAQTTVHSKLKRKHSLKEVSVSPQVSQQSASFKNFKAINLHLKKLMESRVLKSLRPKDALTLVESIDPSWRSSLRLTSLSETSCTVSCKMKGKFFKFNLTRATVEAAAEKVFEEWLRDWLTKSVVEPNKIDRFTGKKNLSFLDIYNKKRMDGKAEYPLPECIWRCRTRKCFNNVRDWRETCRKCRIADATLQRGAEDSNTGRQEKEDEEGEPEQKKPRIQREERKEKELKKNNPGFSLLLNSFIDVLPWEEILEFALYKLYHRWNLYPTSNTAECPLDYSTLDSTGYNTQTNTTNSSAEQPTIKRRGARGGKNKKKSNANQTEDTNKPNDTVEIAQEEKLNPADKITEVTSEIPQPQQSLVTPQQNSVVPQQASVVPQQASVVPQQASVVPQQNLVTSQDNTSTDAHNESQGAEDRLLAVWRANVCRVQTPNTAVQAFYDLMAYLGTPDIKVDVIEAGFCDSRPTHKASVTVSRSQHSRRSPYA